MKSNIEHKRKGIFLGAYAAYSNLDGDSIAAERAFLYECSQWRDLVGLELPFLPERAGPGLLETVSALPQSWDFILTLLPATMQALGRDRTFGLASGDKQGRERAIRLMSELRESLGRLHDREGRIRVVAVHLHSAPTRAPGLDSSVEALRRSLETLRAWDWSGTSLLLEHCDAYKEGQACAKGFLDLKDEMLALQGLGLGITINWGRSVIERRSVTGAREHLAELENSGLLQGIFYSGTARSDPLYGDWLDSHAPIRLGAGQAWDPIGGLLDRAELTLIESDLRRHSPRYHGLKIQPFPKTLSLAQRLLCVREQLDVLGELRGG